MLNSKLPERQASLPFAEMVPLGSSLSLPIVLFSLHVSAP